MLEKLRKIVRLTAQSRNESPTPTVTISLTDGQPIARVDPRYLSFSIDISVIAGGFWWEGSMGTRRGLGLLRIPPLNLNNPKLNLLVQSLGPAYLRVGGSEADKIHYFDRHTQHNISREQDSLVLTQRQWDELHRFISRNHLKFFFTFKYGLFKRKQQGEWAGMCIQHLLQYSKENNYAIDVCELGNELNAYWAFHGLLSQPNARDLANDYATFTQLVKRYYPSIRICGPGSAFWPRIGEAIKPFSNITEKFLHAPGNELDIVDWHYYPFQSVRSPVRTRKATKANTLSVKSFDAFREYSLQLKQLRDISQPHAELWTGETGSAQCGGQPKISDRFMSCFWWADQLGQGARLDQKVMIRQSLIGGDYGLIDRLSLKPRPDYWVSWLWGKLMGTAVYQLDFHNETLRAYAHSNKQTGGICLLLINMSSSPRTVCATGIGPALQRYCITAKKLSAKKVLINGVKPRFKKGAVNLKDFPQASGQAATLPLSPWSINFWCLGTVGSAQ
ncbi:glycosyl hydrolase family 79 N-terminal domain-containing protein [Teredinibacter purpureus]|uniref:glycoside hydrolase n=1 Tax=Teredinibacter purpureus TaxID=2731756 RepID=UPI000A9AD0E7|nr:glycoside hydrolase [Teredinibacter purpureus]